MHYVCIFDSLCVCPLYSLNGVYSTICCWFLTPLSRFAFATIDFRCFFIELELYVIDGITGRIVHHSSYIHALPPTHLIVVDNWCAFTYWNTRKLRSELVVVSFYQDFDNEEGVDGILPVSAFDGVVRNIQVGFERSDWESTEERERRLLCTLHVWTSAVDTNISICAVVMCEIRRWMLCRTVVCMCVCIFVLGAWMFCVCVCVYAVTGFLPRFSPSSLTVIPRSFIDAIRPSQPTPTDRDQSGNATRTNVIDSHDWQCCMRGWRCWYDRVDLFLWMSSTAIPSAPTRIMYSHYYRLIWFIRSSLQNTDSIPFCWRLICLCACACMHCSTRQNIVQRAWCRTSQISPFLPALFCRTTCFYPTFTAFSVYPRTWRALQ